MAAKRETPTKATRKKAASPRAVAKPAPAKSAAARARRAAKPASVKPRAAAATVPATRRSGAARKPAAPRKAPRTARKAAPVEALLVAPGLTEEERIEAAKYLPRDLPKRLFEEERFLFPESYGITRVRLLVKDPEWLFVHWDVDPKTLEALRSELGERVLALTRLTLRIADPDNGGSQTILLPPGSRSWYVRADAGHSRAYKAELGLTLPSGDFRSLTESNTVATPRVGPSPEGPAPRRRVFGSAAAAGRSVARAPGAGKATSAPGEAALEPWKPLPAHADAATPAGAAAAAGADAAPPAGGKARGGASDAFGPPGASETHRR
jgi:hypothetical protein